MNAISDFILSAKSEHLAHLSTSGEALDFSIFHVNFYLNSFCFYFFANSDHFWSVNDNRMSRIRKAEEKQAGTKLCDDELR